jgi:hypothetical protein
MRFSPCPLTGIGGAAHAALLEARERAQCLAEELMRRFAGKAAVEERVRVEADENRVHQPRCLARRKPVRRLHALEECLKVLPPRGRVLCLDLTKPRVMDREPGELLDDPEKRRVQLAVAEAEARDRICEHRGVGFAEVGEAPDDLLAQTQCIVFENGGPIVEVVADVARRHASPVGDVLEARVRIALLADAVVERLCDPGPPVGAFLCSPCHRDASHLVGPMRDLYIMQMNETTRGLQNINCTRLLLAWFPSIRSGLKA